MDKNKQKMNDAFETFKKDSGLQDVFVLAISKELPNEKNAHTILCAFEGKRYRVAESLIEAMKYKPELKEFIMSVATFYAITEVKDKIKMADAKANKKTHFA